MVKVIWTELARLDLKSIHDYISEDSPYYAKRFSEKLLEKVIILEEFPNLGRIVPEFENPSIRELIEGNYRIVYQVLEHRINIVRIHHASGNLKNM